VPAVPEVLRGGFLFMLLLTAGAPYAFAQQPPDGLNDQQRLGRQVFSQSCGVCHLPPARGARTYGPVLGKTSGGGKDDLVRKVILEGTPRMPGFQYMLQPAQVDAIIAYIRTVPAPAPVSGSAVLPEETSPPRRAAPTP
jgi:mono/diheme cytochrome c family protein